MHNLKSSFSIKKNDNNVQQLIRKATHYTQAQEDWDLFIKICTEVNCTKGASQKARVALSKHLYAFKEPQTQYLALSLLREISTNCSIFEGELRNVEFITSISNLWHSNLRQKVRDNFSFVIGVWMNAYRDDLYLHHLTDFCHSVCRQNNVSIVPSRRRDVSKEAQAWFRQASHQPQSPPQSLTYYDDFGAVPISHIIDIQPSHRHSNAYAPNNTNTQQRGDMNLQTEHDNHIDPQDIRRPISTLSPIENPFLTHAELRGAAGPSSTDRNNSYNMILRSSKSVPTDKGKGRLNDVPSMDRYEMDALIHEAETASKLLTELITGSIGGNYELLEEMHEQCRDIHSRIIKQVWTLEGDQLYQDALTDAARNLYICINQYKKTVNEKQLIETSV